ncbi:MAG: beta-glucuronidase [Bacteroidaceae bacterium]|nr:beta-glucuronidase [Bacteroidaceae bacterium]
MNSKSLIFSLCAVAVAFISVRAQIPRPEYPRPQMERSEWINLNGEWTYQLDPLGTGSERRFHESTGFGDKINVPFAPESPLSGVSHAEFIPSIWYQRNITIPSSWDGLDVVLNFGAVYYESEVFVDGQFVGRHFGGSDPFSLDITKFVKPGCVHSLVVNAKSDLRSRLQPAGKQSLRFGAFECMYSRTTGIWQTVWMEPVAKTGIANVKILPNIDSDNVSMIFRMRRDAQSNTITIDVRNSKGKVVATVTSPVNSGDVITLPIQRAELWTPESPYLYDVNITLYDSNKRAIDTVKSYFGMRKVHTENNLFYLNNKPYFQRLVLDQGFYPDGNWTAPSDEALRRDIELGKSAGFNGARLHQKVFEDRYYYWADRLGYLTWGESPSWGLDANDPIAARNFLSEWSNIVFGLSNHPSLVVWTPFNEQWWPDEVQYPRFITDVYNLTKQLDPSRPVNTVSGGIHIVSDIWTGHTYEQDPDKLRSFVLNNGKMFVQQPDVQSAHRGNVGFNRPVLNAHFTFPQYDGSQPYILDEFGGIRCIEANPTKDGAWGYGESPLTKEEFYSRLEGQVAALMSLSDKLWGFCYTQLTDVEQEQNGLFYYDRTMKYDMDRVKSIFTMVLE